MSDEKAEEDSYSVIFSSLRHPIRRRILRMLKDKPLTFSEILTTLTMDSGHLSYHLESLGDLITRTPEEKYALSSIGIAAVKLMGGVEEHEIRSSQPKFKISHVIEPLYRAVLVGALIVVSIYFLTFTTQQFSMGIGGDSWVPTAPIKIAPGQTLKFNITVQYTKPEAMQWYRIDIQNATFVAINATTGEGDTQGVGFKIGNTTIVPIEMAVPIIGEGGLGTYNYTFFRGVPTNTPSVWETGSLKFEITLNETSGTTMENGTAVIVLSTFPAPPDAQITVHKPDGSVVQASGVTDWDIQHGFFGLTPISSGGTYTFEIRNNSPKELDAFLKPIAEWQLEEKPYLYYGIGGLIISAIYPIMILARIANSRLRKKQHALAT